MKAITLKAFGGTENFELIEMDLPAPKNDELLIKIKASAFNPIDYQMRQGRRESELMTSPILGRELSGIVEAVGDKVKNFKIGDSVFTSSGSSGSNGSYAEYILLTEARVALMPVNISFEQAASIPSAGLTAWQTFNRLQIKENDSIFITGGSGAVGSFLIRLLKYNHIHQIVTIAGNDKSRAALIELGLAKEQILAYQSPDLKNKVLAANDRKPFDYAVDLVGSTMAEVAAAVLKINGTYADITFLGTAKTRERLFDIGAKVLNISNYAFALDNQLNWYAQTLTRLKELIAHNQILPPSIKIVGSFSVKTVQEAHELMEQNLTNGQKLVMSIG